MAYSPHVQVRAHTTTYASSPFASVILSKRKRISVKDLLEWAYRDEIVHAARPENMPLDLVRDYSPGPIEWRVDVVDSSAKYGFEAHADAYRVHRAVLALGDEPLTVPAWSGPPSEVVGQFPQRAPLKTQSLSALVMGAALRGAPDPILHPEIEVKRGGTVIRRQPNGQPARDRNGRALEELCLVQFSGDLPWIVAHQRFLYRQWALALWRLADSLPPLDAYELSTTLPPRQPWLFC